jgi:aspartyl-tRNA(Asn)/glutamyl-tRNA(Gln) amidotransferase subunit B
LNKAKKSLAESFLTVEKFVTVIKLLETEKINAQAAKKVMDIIINEDADPMQVIEKNNLMQTADSGEVEAMVEKLLADNAKVVAQIKGGDQKPIGFLIGQLMKVSGGKADPKKARELILNKISQLG